MSLVENPRIVSEFDKFRCISIRSSAAHLQPSIRCSPVEGVNRDLLSIYSISREVGYLLKSSHGLSEPSAFTNFRQIG